MRGYSAHRATPPARAISLRRFSGVFSRAACRMAGVARRHPHETVRPLVSPLLRTITRRPQSHSQAQCAWAEPGRSGARSITSRQPNRWPVRSMALPSISLLDPQGGRDCAGLLNSPHQFERFALGAEFACLTGGAGDDPSGVVAGVYVSIERHEADFPFLPAEPCDCGGGCLEVPGYLVPLSVPVQLDADSDRAINQSRFILAYLHASMMPQSIVPVNALMMPQSNYSHLCRSAEGIRV